MRTALPRTTAPAYGPSMPCVVHGVWSRDSFPRLPIGDLVAYGNARLAISQRS